MASPSNSPGSGEFGAGRGDEGRAPQTESETESPRAALAVAGTLLAPSSSDGIAGYPWARVAPIVA